ncbi:MAG: hypothetical protein ACRD8Z_10350 [Nitrososphaeraceae archaeon]
MRWIFLVAALAFTIASTTDLHASDFNATEVAKCMIAKSPYYGSFDRWDYAGYCGGDADWWSMTSTERMEIQCKIDELTGITAPDAGTSTDESPSDYYDRGMYDDLSERLC